MLDRPHPRRRYSPPSRRPLGRLLGAGALVVSVFLHGGAAAVALLVLPRVMSRADADHHEEPPALVDLDVVTPTEPEAEPRSAPSLDTPARSTSGRRSRSVPAPAPVPHARRSVPAAPDPARIVVGAEEPDRHTVPRFSLSAGIVAGRADPRVEANAPPGAAERGDATPEDTRPLAESAVDAPARLATAAPLVYPEAARRADLEFDLPLELTVSTQGRVLSATALAHPGYGLESAALTAVRSYIFHPARRAGRRVPVRMTWTMQFRLH